MSRDFERSQRVADFLRKEVSQLIQYQMRDPRLGMVSVTEVEVSRDLGHARIFVTVMGCDDKDSAAETIKVLNRASGFLRSELAKITTMRSVPTLKFIFDESIVRGQHLSSLIDEARQSDQLLAGHEKDNDEN